MKAFQTRIKCVQMHGDKRKHDAFSYLASMCLEHRVKGMWNFSYRLFLILFLSSLRILFFIAF